MYKTTAAMPIKQPPIDEEQAHFEEEEREEIEFETKSSLGNYAKYSTIGFQMLGVMLVGAVGGIYLDKYLGTTPIFTVVLLLTSVCYSMYLIIRLVSERS